MAGLIGLTAADIELQDALRVDRWEYEGDWIPHPVVRLTTTMPVVRADAGARVAVRATWGFPVGGGRPIGNARDDRLTESRMWSSMLGNSHCLVATTGVYEMIGKGADKQSYWFRPAGGERFIVMPGLLGWRKHGGDERAHVAIVTTEPNRFFARYHQRQVCALEPDEQQSWLSATGHEAALDCLHAPADDAWEAVPIDNRIFGKGIREMEDLVETGPVETLGSPPPATAASKPSKPSKQMTL